jgi:hypothetical protein
MMRDRTNVGEESMRANERHAEAWNGPESAHFVDHADRYDRQLDTFTQALLERAGRSSTSDTRGAPAAVPRSSLGRVSTRTSG